MIVLGLLGTGVAYILLFRLIRSAGPSRTSLVTYLIPGIALLYGVLLLGEPLRALYIVGLALILAGVMLAGRSGSKRRKAAVAVAAPARSTEPDRRASPSIEGAQSGETQPQFEGSPRPERGPMQGGTTPFARVGG